MAHFNEHTQEMAIMELFEQQGYNYVNGETIHKEQTEVLLRDDLRMYLMDRYAEEGITPLEVERVIARLTADNATPSTNNPDLWCDNGISWLSPADLSKKSCKFISKGAKDITELGYNSCSTKLLPKGSILFSSRAPIGLMAITTKELCTNQGFKSIVPQKDYGSEYVYYYLLSIKDKIAEENTGSTFDEVSGQTMKEYPAILPSKQVTDKFSELMRPILYNQFNKEQENEKLTELQSLLLAKMGQ